MPLPVHSSCTVLRRFAMPPLKLSEKACFLLRDFMLVFDLDDFLKGSSAVTESDAGTMLEYIKTTFEDAGLPAPTTYMSPKGLSTYLKSLRSPNQKFKKEHAATYELIKCVFELCHIDTTDGLLPAIIKAKGKPAPAYFVAKGVAKRKLNDATAVHAAAEKEWAEEKKRSDAKIEDLYKKVAELQSTVDEMIAKRDGAQKLGFSVIGGTSTAPVLAESNKVLTNKLVELKSTLSEVTPKQGKEGKAHTYNSTLMAMLRRLVADSGIPEERLCQVVHYVYAALFHKPYDGDVPSAQCVRDWIDDLNYKDMEMLTALLKNVCKTRSVHILADSSKRDVERHAIQVTFWDDEKDQPVTVTVALAVVAASRAT